MPTTNPVPSTDPSDLLFNAGKLDEVVNGTANSFTDRLGATRRTVAGMNADFDAQLADAESDLNVYRADAAASAAEALGYLQTIRATSYGAYASDPATDPLGNPPTEGDEYWNTTAKLLKRWNGSTWQASDINTANLAAPSGASLVGYDGGTVQDVLDAVTGPNGAASVGYTPSGVGAVATTVQAVLREAVSVKGYGAVGDGVTDDSAAVQVANTYAQSIGATLLFPAGGTYACKALTLGDVHIEGVIKAIGSAKADAVVFAGSVEAPERRVFTWTAANPTNIPGTTYPFLFSATSTWGGKVNIKWFGATGDNVTDDTAAINACATAMSFAQVNGTPYATKRGPVTMFSPRGNYRIGTTVNITLGTVLEGVASGSNPLSTWIKDDVTYGATANDMIWWVGDNETHTSSAAQCVIKDMSFIWRPSIDYNSSTLQLDTAFMAFKAWAIDVKLHGCWFLGSPQKGSIFSWGNKHTAAGGGGLQKTITGADSDGINVTIHTYDTFIDVCYGSIVTLFDKGQGQFTMNSGFIYQNFLGLVRNYSTHSGEKPTFTANTTRLYAIGAVSASPTIYDPANKATTLTTGQVLYRRTDFNLNSCYITNKLMGGTAFFFSQSLNDCAMRLSGCTVDSIDSTVNYYHPIFDLTSYANSLTLKGNSFIGAMTPNAVVPGYNKAIITKYQGSGALNGLTSKVFVVGNDIELGTNTTYLLYKYSAQAQINDTEITGNIIKDKGPSAVFFATAGATTYRIGRNVWGSTDKNFIESDWTTPTLLNSWVAFSGSDTAQYKMDANGCVILRGRIKSGSYSTKAFTLPAGFRPGTNTPVRAVVKAGATNTSYGYLEIDSSGDVYPIAASDGSNVEFSLNGVRFEAVQ